MSEVSGSLDRYVDISSRYTKTKSAEVLETFRIMGRTDWDLPHTINYGNQ